MILGEWKFITLLQGVSNPGEIQEELSEQNRALRETRVRNLRDMEVLQKRHVSKVVELSRRKLTEDQNTIMELRATIQELQNEVNCVNDFRDFLRMPSQHLVDHPSFIVNQCFSHLHPDLGPDLGGMQSRSLGMPSRNNGPPGTRMVYRETFLQIQRRLLQHLIQEDAIFGFLT